MKFDHPNLGGPNDELTLAEISNIIARLSELLHAGKIDLVEKFLLSVDIDAISPDGITAIYRTTFLAPFKAREAIDAKFKDRA